MARKPRIAPMAEVAAPALAPKRVIIFVHGIRDPAFWSQKLRSLFEAQGFVAVPIGFYVFDIFRFLLGVRRKAVERVKLQIKDAIDSNPGAEVTIIAHSFGTYVVTRLLDEDPSLDITRLIMCGGIVRRNYRWDKTVRLNAQGAGRMRVINEHSGRDIWPLFARHATLGFGDSGSIGCQDANVIDRQHDVRHSEYLTERFAKMYWIPHIARGEPLADPKAEGKASWMFFLNRMPVTALAAVAAIAVGLLGYVVLDKITFKTQGTMAYSKDAAGIGFRITGQTHKDSLPEPIYAAQVQGPLLEHKLLSNGKYRFVAITIFNRIPIVCNAEALDDAPTPKRDEQNTTYYEFDLANAHHFLGRSEFRLKYESPVDAGGKTVDRLTLGAGEGIDPAKVKLVRVIHSDQCLDESFPTIKNTPFVKIQALEPPDSEQQSGLLLGNAFAQYAPKLNKDDISKFIRSKDAPIQSLGLDAVRARPLENAATVKAIIEDPATDPETLAKLLLAARSTAAAPIPLDIVRVIDLTVADDNRVRDAARTYLRSPGVVSDGVARSIDAAVGSKLPQLRASPVPGKSYGRDYLLLIAARDVYYNLGVQKLEAHSNAVMAGAKGDVALAIAAFEQGRALRALAGNEQERISLAKNTYGRGLAEYRAAMLAQAMAMGGKGTPADIIASARAAQLPLKDQASIQSFKALLEEVKSNPSLYPWPAHLDQARRCIEKLTFACLSGSDGIKD